MSKDATVLMIGDTVDLKIGKEFLPNGVGRPIVIKGRVSGRLTEWDRFGNAVVDWPNGETYSYESALLVKSRLSREEHQ